MARISRVEIFAPDEVAIVHCVNRTVRRCFLLGEDPVTGKNFDHRKAWMEVELRNLAKSMGIDLLGYSILSNHYHLILRSRPDIVATWDDSEIARRWLMLCPKRKKPDGSADEPNELELDSIRSSPAKVKEIRLRLSDISWWIRLLSQKIAQRANKADGEVGKFWQARYKAVRILDETALLACAAYVDLNPIRAAMAETLEQSDYTSIQRRIEDLKEQASSKSVEDHSSEPSQQPETNSSPAPSFVGLTRSAFLAPICLGRSEEDLGACPSSNGYRASDKGFLEVSVAGYIELLDWTARQLVKGKRGATPADAAPVFERLGLTEEVWVELVRDFGALFSAVAGKPKVIDATRSPKRQQRYNIRPRTRELLPS
ncbi:transposase [Pirellulaceae bacterium SH449]